MAVNAPERPPSAAPSPDGSHDDLGVSPEHREAQTADLENLFAAPSAGNHDKELNLFNDNDSGSILSSVQTVFTKKRMAGGGVAGLLIGVVFGGMTIISGPMQLIHIAQLLQGFHFSSLSDSGDDRMVKIARFLQYKGDERMRLSKLGNKYADKIEKRFNATGIESSYGNGSYLDGYTIDRAMIPDGSELAPLRSMTPDEAKLHLESRYGVKNVTINPEGKFIVPADDLGYVKNRKLISLMMKDAGYSKVTTAINTRVMGKRAGIDWHPMKKLDKKTKQSLAERLTEWRKQRQAKIDDGDLSASTTSDTPGDTDSDAKKAANEEANKAKTATDETIQESKTVAKDIESGVVSEGPDSSLAKFQSSTALKLAGGAAAAVGVVCMVKGISENMDALQHAKVVLPLMRVGMQAITLGNQVMVGKDVDMQQLGFFAKQLTDSKTDTSWLQARSIQAELGQPTDGPDMPADAKVDPNGNVVSEFMHAIPGIDSICKAAGSTAGQVIGIAISFVGGPVSAVAGVAAGLASGPVIQRLSAWLVGHPISIDVAGANYGNYINYGARLAANDQAIASGGRKLSPVETAQLREIELNNNQDEQKKKSFADRMLNPYNTSSLLSSIIDKQSPTISGNVSNMASATMRIGNIFGSITRNFASLVTNNRVRAAAQTSYDYGFSKYGFSVSELNSQEVSNPFENGSKVADLLASTDGGSYIDRAKKCFGVTLGADGSVAGGTSSPAYKDIDNSGGNCGDPSVNWLRIRMYILDTETMEAAACWNGSTQSCENSGFSGSNISDATAMQAAMNPPSIGTGFMDYLGLLFKPNAL